MKKEKAIEKMMMEKIKEELEKEKEELLKRKGQEKERY